MDRDNDKAVSDEELSPRLHWGKKNHERMDSDDDNKDEQDAQ
jgi:hypothetical protein